jgi:hypothetical protein
MLQTQGQVALFVDTDGIMACTEAGMVVPIAPGYQVPAGARVSFGAQRIGALRQIFMGIHGS